MGAIRIVGLAVSETSQALLACIEASNRVAQTERLPIGMHLMSHRRILRAAKMDCLTRPWRDRAPLKAYIQSVVELCRGRLPHALQEFQVELDHVNDLETSYPLAEEARNLQFIRENMTLSALNLARYPLGPG